MKEVWNILEQARYRWISGGGILELFMGWSGSHAKPALSLSCCFAPSLKGGGREVLLDTASNMLDVLSAWTAKGTCVATQHLRLFLVCRVA
jgi:hypothetical protein